MKHLQDYLITVDSFGPYPPENWEEIADSINEYLEELWDKATDQDRAAFRDTVADVWEDYCNHEGAESKPLNLDRVEEGEDPICVDTIKQEDF
jgi:hypothetical protein